MSALQRAAIWVNVSVLAGEPTGGKGEEPCRQLLPGQCQLPNVEATNVSDIPLHPYSVKDFASSQEAGFRRRTRDMVRKSNLTRAEKDILLAFLNHWFVHRHKGPVHPGRKRLAKKAGASIRAVNYTLAMLRDCGVLRPMAYATGNQAGERGKATEYEVDQIKLITLCEVPEALLKKARKGAKPVNTGCKIARFKGAKSAPRNNQCNVIPFRGQGEGK